MYVYPCMPCKCEWLSSDTYTNILHRVCIYWFIQLHHGRIPLYFCLLSKFDSEPHSCRPVSVWIRFIFCDTWTRFKHQKSQVLSPQVRPMWQRLRCHVTQHEEVFEHSSIEELLRCKFKGIVVSRATLNTFYLKLHHTWRPRSQMDANSLWQVKQIFWPADHMLKLVKTGILAFGSGSVCHKK